MFEYKVSYLTPSDIGKLGDVLNQAAAEGYQLKQIVESSFKTAVIFEREVTSAKPAKEARKSVE